MVIAKLNKSNIFDGCLSYLRSELVGELPEGQTWHTDDENGIINLIGCEEVINEHNKPYQNASAYYIIYFGYHFIKPVSFSLLGRRAFDKHLVKGLNFYGRAINNEWILLNSSKSQLNAYELRNFEINEPGPFNAFMLKMTEQDSEGMWALAIGQIDVYGYIYDRFPERHDCFTQSIQIFRICKVLLFIVLL